ncbi:hypothetical protein GGX14DRAFT_406096 [Mycena pura]|uniref:Uncharacterized protein n=1 Tax=Mycena pura TaxID=153505 RepID=A0AAD6UQT1_9AGAR|nr:hypothetical protein GGX14DRAFT_406096 [Mycena pura]
MSKDSRLTAAQWVACESYHDAMLKFVDRSGGDPGKEPDGYDIYQMHVPKAPVMADFPETQRQWLGPKISEKFRTSQGHRGSVRKGPLERKFPHFLAGAALRGRVHGVRKFSDVTLSPRDRPNGYIRTCVSHLKPLSELIKILHDLVHMPDVIARTVGEVLAMANAQHSAKRPARCLPRYGASAGTRPFMGRPNRTRGGLVGHIGGTLGAKGWKRGPPAKMKGKRYSGRKSALKKGKKVRVDVAAVVVPTAGPSTVVEPKRKDTPFPETVAPGDVFMADVRRQKE